MPITKRQRPFPTADRLRGVSPANVWLRGHNLRNLSQFHVEFLRGSPQNIERFLSRDVSPTHEDALRLPDHVATVYRLMQLSLAQLRGGNRFRGGQGQGCVGR